MILESGELNIQSEVEKIIKKKNCSYMDAVLQICEKHEIDPSYIAKHLSICRNIYRSIGHAFVKLKRVFTIVHPGSKVYYSDNKCKN